MARLAHSSLTVLVHHFPLTRCADALVGADGPGPRAGDAQAVEMLGDPLEAPAGLLQLQDVQPDAQLLLVAGNDPHVAAGLSGRSPRGQFLEDLARGIDQDAPEAVGGVAAGPIAALGQEPLGRDDALGQLAQELAALVVAEEHPQLAADVDLAPGHRRHDAVAEDDRDPGQEQAPLEGDHLAGVLGASQAVAAVDEQVGDGRVGQGVAPQGEESRPRQVGAGDAVIEADVPVLGELAGLHPLQVGRRGVQRDGESARLGDGPLQLGLEAGLLAAGGPAEVDQAPVLGSIGHRRYPRGVPACRWAQRRSARASSRISSSGSSSTTSAFNSRARPRQVG